MKLKSITFDCPILFRGHITSIEEVHAPELNYYVNSIAFNLEHAYLITVEYNNEQYVVENKYKHFKDKKTLKKINMLSRFLQSRINVIEVTYLEDSYSFNTVYSHDQTVNENSSLKEKIISKYPNLIFVEPDNKLLFEEYNAYMSTVRSWVGANIGSKSFLVVLDYQENKYVIIKFKKKKKAEDFVNSMNLIDATIVHVVLNEDKMYSIIKDSN